MTYLEESLRKENIIILLLTSVKTASCSDQCIKVSFNTWHALASTVVYLEISTLNFLKFINEKKDYLIIVSVQTMIIIASNDDLGSNGCILFQFIRRLSHKWIKTFYFLQGSTLPSIHTNSNKEISQYSEFINYIIIPCIYQSMKHQKSTYREKNILNYWVINTL